MPGELVLGTQQALALERTEPSIMEIIAAVARDPNVDVARIDALVALKERMEARDAEKVFNAAFAAAMMEMPRVAKRGKKDMKEKGCIAYATYEDVDAAIRPIETKHGFARSFATRTSDKPGCIMVLRLTHRAGHSITSERYCRPDPGPGRNDTQAEGSGESYGRRYLTLAVWNIVTVGADDDANSADPISDEQAMALRTMLDYLAMTPQQATRFWAWIGPSAVNVETIQRKDFERVNRWLSDRVKAQEAQRGGASRANE
jgi:hypothetical protein